VTLCGEVDLEKEVEASSRLKKLPYDKLMQLRKKEIESEKEAERLRQTLLRRRGLEFEPEDSPLV